MACAKYSIPSQAGTDDDVLAVKRPSARGVARARTPSASNATISSIKTIAPPCGSQSVTW
jgi:hypothetical protein